MTARTFVVIISIYLVTVAFVSCSTSNNNENEENPNNNLPATVYFHNDSSFPVDIFKNFNPNYFDPSTLVCTVNPADTHEEKIYASDDQVIGDKFYPHYKIPLADKYDTGTTNIFVDAERNMTNISFVIKSGETHTVTIPKTQKGETKFSSGVLIIYNLRATQVQIENWGKILEKMDDKSVYLPGLMKGYYEIPFHSYTDTMTINQLNAFGSSLENFPAFDMERGKKYWFNIKDSGIEGPLKIEDIYPTK